MKHANAKRALAFWLAVAILASSAPMALAADDTGAPEVSSGVSDDARDPALASITGTDVNLADSPWTVGTQVNVDLAQKAAPSGGQSPYQYTSSNLPDGIKLAQNGLLTGAPTQATSSNQTFKVTVTDSTSSAPQTTEITVTYKTEKATGTVSADQLSKTIQASDTANKDANSLKASLPNTLTVTYGGGSKSLGVTWADTSVSFEPKGADYTYTGTLASDSDVTVANVTYTLKVTPVQAKLDQAITISKNKDQIAQASQLSDILPEQVAINGTSYNASWDKTLDEIKTAANSNEMISVNLKLADMGLPAWMTIQGVTLSATIQVNNPQEKQLTITNASALNVTYGTDVPDPAVTVADVDSPDASKFTYQYKGRSGTNYSESKTKPTQAGDYTLTVTYDDGKVRGTKTADFTIAKAQVNEPTIPAITLAWQEGQNDAAYRAQVVAKAGETKVTGVKGTTVAGTFAVTAVQKDGSSGTAFDSAGQYTVTLSFTPSGNDAPNYEVKTGISAKVTLAASQGGDFGFLESEVKKTYGDTAFTKTPENIPSGQSVTYSSNNQTVATVDTSGKVTIVGVGTAIITATCGTKTASYNLTVAQGTFNGTKAQTANVNKGKTATIAIPDEIAKLDGVTYVVSVGEDTNKIISGSPAIQGKSLVVTASGTATANQTATVKVQVNSKNYQQFELTYTLTVVDKTDVSDKITFNSKTVTANGSAQKLDNASISGITAGANAKFTYAVSGAKNAVQGTMPAFKDAGVYTIVATYEDDNNYGTKTATLTIQNPVTSAIKLSTSQMDSKRDDNYSNFNRSERNVSDGYMRLYLDGTDDLERQSVDGTNSEWVGVDITPSVNGQKTTNLYVSTSKSGSYTKLASNTRMGDFYIDRVYSEYFELWYDTDDRDCADNLWLATDQNGSNAFQLYVDFDSYRYDDDDDDDDDDRDSTSTSTSTVGGDKVVTTTIDKSPSVKSGTASVTVSSSMIDSAIKENNRVYKDKKADGKVISIDANTSRSCDETVVTLTKKAVDKVADEDTSLKFVTKQGTVTIDDRALTRLADQASGSDIDFYVEKDRDNEFKLYAKSGRSAMTDLGTGDATITLPYSLGKNEKASDLRVYRVGDAEDVWASLDVYAATGYVTEMKDVSYKSSKVTFTADALGTFRITDERMTTDTPTTPSGTFYDVPNSRWSAPYIYKLANLGIISGTGNGMFEPTLYVTREEFVKILAGVAGANVSSYTQSKFTDVPASRWSAPYIAWAASMGITQGDTPNQFAPTKYISRQEMATMIYRYVQIAGKNLPARNPAKTFADASRIASWAVTPVTVMQQAGIIDGNVSGGRYTFDPLLSASREECAKMLAVLYDLI